MEHFHPGQSPIVLYYELVKLLLPVSLPEGQKDQVGQVVQPSGLSLGQTAKGQALNLRWSEDKSLSGIVKGEYSDEYYLTPLKGDKFICLFDFIQG